MRKQRSDKGVKRGHRDVQKAMKDLNIPVTVADVELHQKWSEAHLKNHKTYQGKRTPRCECPFCWDLYKQKKQQQQQTSVVVPKSGGFSDMPVPVEDEFTGPMQRLCPNCDHVVSIVDRHRWTSCNCGARVRFDSTKICLTWDGITRKIPRRGFIGKPYVPKIKKGA